MNIRAAEKLPDTAGLQPISIPIGEGRRVSGLFQPALNGRACYVLAHGAGAGMEHPFLADLARGLAQRRIHTLRYQFPYMELGSKRPDPPKLAQGTVRAAVVQVSSLVPDVALFAGGKSFGGRMTSQAQAESPLPKVRGLVFLGFPLHPPGRPSDERGRHLFEIKIPMLFLQGDRDEFADLGLLQSLMHQLGPRATLKLFPDANHSFHVPARSGHTDAEIHAQILDVMKDWIESVIAGSPHGNAKS